MARQTFWKGYLKLSLVTAAVSPVLRLMMLKETRSEEETAV